MKELIYIKEVEAKRSLSRPNQRYKQALYRCHCGKEFVAMIRQVKVGDTKSCGCSKYIRTHGMCYSTTYQSWASMKYRCSKKSKDYDIYMGRGITVCDRWIESFENFYEDMGERPKGTSIDRIDNDGNYEPGNCRWATTTEQAMNKSTNTILEYNGEKNTITQWAYLTGISKATICSRLYTGKWSIEETLTKKVRKRSKNTKI